MQHHGLPIQINSMNQIPKHYSNCKIIPYVPHHAPQSHGRNEVVLRQREALLTAIVPQRRRSHDGLKLKLLAGGAEPGILEDHAADGDKDVVRPPVASFTPNMWGDSFTSLSLDDEVQRNYAESIEALREEVRSMLMADEKNRAEKLVLIDTLERLGIGYHFEQVIEDQLQQIFQSSNSTNEDPDQEDGDDLFITSLQFRLLRQHRHYVPCSVFDKFKEAEGDNNKFKESLHGDAKGLLSLYEAAHMQTHGEDMLEEAVAFTTHHLKRLLTLGQLELSSSLQYQVSRALDQPLYRGAQRIETRYYISSYDKDDTRNETLLKFAKLDFNYVQNIYKKELHQVSRWWNELDLKSKLPYTRDRIVEAYLLGMVFRFEPQFSGVRIAVSKAIQMVTNINDTYDNYATVEEADLFTEAMERWDINEIHGLPNKMKTVYRYVLSIYDDYEREAAKQGKLFAVPYAKETVKQLCRAYNKELKWSTGVQVPTFEEYLVNSVITSTIYVLATAAFLHMKHASSDLITMDWLMSEPKILCATNLLGRYWNDSVSHERESKDGQMLTGVDFYMRQYGLSKKETIDKFEKLGDDEWKKVIAAWITPPVTCGDMAYEVLNMARAIEIMYKKCEDIFSSPEIIFKKLIKYMFVDPIPTD